MHNRLLDRARRLGLVAAIVTAGITLLPGAASAATATPAPSTTVTLSAAQVAQALFVAGDVGRLEQDPSGVEDVVLEKVLQQLYLENPTLDAGRAMSDIQSLQSDLTSGPNAIAPSTLTLMAGNEQILAILSALNASSPPAAVAHAIDQVGDQAVDSAAGADTFEGNAFDASADSLSTLDFSSFSPATVLAASWSLAAVDKPFGTARDDVWQSTSHESVFDSTQTLAGENPALQNSAIQSLTSQLAADGSLTTTVGALEQLVQGGVAQIGDQSCTLASGTTGASPSNCQSGALHDAQIVTAACPGGTTTGSGCTSARSQAESDEAAELASIAAQEAVSTAAGTALGQASTSLEASETAEAQAAAQIADQENAYLAWQTTQSVLKTGFDVATLGLTLSVSEIDPVNAITGLFNVIGDAIGLSFGGPDPNTIILQGIQNLSQQLSDFETYTQSAFAAINTSLAGISSQIAQESYQLSAQLTQAQQQITALGTKLTQLQGSVDHLESEVQSLFAQGANNDLNTIINQDLGYQQANGTPLPQAQFAQAAGALYQDATNTSLTTTVLTPPTGFDAFDADNLVTASDPLSLDSNINYFNLFGAEVSDAPPGEGWPGPLTTACAPGANPGGGLCLPNPDYWATAARAFAQLLQENPQYVTPTRITQLNTIDEDGQTIANALSQLSVDNAGADVNGTGNKTLDAALQYYQLWAYAAAGNAEPSLFQAISNEEQHYLSNLPVPNLSPLTYGPVDPWGGETQTPDAAGLTATSLITTLQIPVCASEINDGITGNINPNNYLYAQKLTTADFSFLPSPVLNALRLGIGSLSACYTASFGVPLSSTGGPFTVTLELTYNGPSGSGISGLVGTLTGSSSYESECGIGDQGNQEIQALDAVAAGCNDLDTLLGDSNAESTFLPSAVGTYVDSQVTAALAGLQSGVYNDLISNIQSGDSPAATNVQAAAKRLDGAATLLDGYISLGLPQALASDDTLQSLVSGQNEDAFAMTGSGNNPWGAAFAADVPTALVHLYQAALTAMPSSDPVYQIASDVYTRSADLAPALQAHIVTVNPGAAGADAGAAARPVGAGIDVAGTGASPIPPNSGVLAEDNPLITPTLDTLAQTQAGLTDLATNGAQLFVSTAGPGQGTVSSSGAAPTGGAAIGCPANCSAAFAPGSTVTLAATPTAGSAFAGWSGSCSGTATTCTVQLDYDTFATASFVTAAGGSATSPGAATTTTSATTTTTTAVTTPTTTAAVTTTPAPAPVTVAHTTKIKCTVTPAAQLTKAGRVTVTLRCSAALKVTLNGALTIQTKTGAKRTKTTTLRLKAARAALKAGRQSTLTVSLPAAAATARAKQARETVSFTLQAGSLRVKSKAVAIKAPSPKRR